MRTTALRLLALAGTAALAAAASGCGSSGDTSVTPLGPNDVGIQNFSFGPDPLTVKVGTTVTWRNRDSDTHTATADSGDPVMFDTGNIAGGKNGTVTFATAGTYHYHCNIHQYMTGTITVTS